jgi:hypothetical protein
VKSIDRAWVYPRLPSRSAALRLHLRRSARASERGPPIPGAGAACGESAMPGRSPPSFETHPFGLAFNQRRRHRLPCAARGGDTRRSGAARMPRRPWRASPSKTSPRQRPGREPRTVRHKRHCQCRPRRAPAALQPGCEASGSRASGAEHLRSERDANGDRLPLKSIWQEERDRTLVLLTRAPFAHPTRGNSPPSRQVSPLPVPERAFRDTRSAAKSRAEARATDLLPDQHTEPSARETRILP